MGTWARSIETGKERFCSPKKIGIRTLSVSRIKGFRHKEFYSK